jgi:hypothetical protein
MTICLTICLAKYVPLVLEGQNAIAQFSISTYVDASCRRETDLECEPPSISALCRGELFAPHLKEGDEVVYIIRPDPRYKGVPPKGNHPLGTSQTKAVPPLTSLPNRPPVGYRQSLSALEWPLPSCRRATVKPSKTNGTPLCGCLKFLAR